MKQHTHGRGEHRNFDEEPIHKPRGIYRSELGNVEPNPATTWVLLIVLSAIGVGSILLLMLSGK
jgi:hypothetical protein